MNYESVALTLPKEDVRARILRRLPELRTDEDDGEYVFRNRLGFHLASLSDTTLPTGERGSRLTYRTTVLSPTAAHARQQARQIRQAVDEFVARAE